MTIKEAIKILDNLKPGDYSNPYEKGEAIVMAISALRAQVDGDYISRQAAIEWCMKGLNNMPSAEPERKKGKWIPQDFNKHNGMVSTAVYYYPKCSVCGNSANYTNFCPNCGARMENAYEGSD